MLTCEGTAYPHKKVVWYRLLNSSNPSSGLPISSFWSKRYYYDTSRGDTTSKDQISSTLIIHKFNKGYVGKYYCVLTNGKISVKSPTTHFKPGKLIILLSSEAAIGINAECNIVISCVFKIVFAIDDDTKRGPGQDQIVTETEPIRVLNITATRVNNTSILVTWNKVQRNNNTDKFCKIWKPGKEKQLYQWTLHILRWDDWTDFKKNDKTIKDSNTMEFIDYNSANGHIDNQTLDKKTCQNQYYVLTNVSSTAYYKFQITVQRYKKNIQEEFVARNGSYIHYFAEQS